jgi:hypothetical protein
MTYFSDFETTEYMYEDYNVRQSILKDVEGISLCDSIETVSEDLLEAFCGGILLRDSTETVPDDLLKEFDDLY